MFSNCFRIPVKTLHAIRKTAFCVIYLYFIQYIKPNLISSITDKWHIFMQNSLGRHNSGGRESTFNLKIYESFSQFRVKTVSDLYLWRIFLITDLYNLTTLFFWEICYNSARRRCHGEACSSGMHLLRLGFFSDVESCRAGVPNLRI